MRIPYLLLSIVCVLFLVIDIRLYYLLLKRCASKVPARIQLGFAIMCYAVMIVALCMPRRDGSDAQLLSVMWMLFALLSVYVSKGVFVIVDGIASLPRLWHKGRWRWLTLTGGILSVVIFLLIWWGALINRFRVDVREVEVEIPDLPAAFDGYRMVQFSDLHTGTYGSDTTFVSYLVDRINALDGDVILFTGDIVNRRTEELLPFVDVLGRLDAPDGVYSILGNHDYGDYSDWPSEEAKQQNLLDLHRLQRSMGWRLLLNEHEAVYHDGDSIMMVGVENVGDPPFATYGSLADAYPELSDRNVKILLSHNPAHWQMDIERSDTSNIALTLAGHTHAMQIEAFGISPAAFRYRYWGGLYKSADKRRQLYVNIGAGTVGMPMRLGATPEITVITLRKAGK